LTEKTYIPDNFHQTRQSRVVFSKHLNSNGTLFGGEAMQWLDEVALITATRYTRQRMITVKIEQVSFLKPILPNSILDITGRIVGTNHVKIFIKVEVHCEDMFSQRREKVMEADFIFAACNNDLSPTILKIQKDD
jgi:acyl-CoA hydrolase